jgi:hypothetical protein
MDDARWMEQVHHLEQRAASLRHTSRLAGLRAQGDERSLALADWLEAGAGDAAASARLRERALRSSDGLLLALALTQWQHCRDAGCRSPLAQRWRELEPRNLQALLADTHGRDVGTLLTDVGQSTHSESHRGTALALLARLAPDSSRGPLELMETVDLIGRGAAWPLPTTSGAMRLRQACRAPDERLAAPCARLAEQLWNLADEDPVESYLALRIAGSQPALHGSWSARALEWQALQELIRRATDPKRFNGWMEQALQCRGAAAELRAQMQRINGRQTAAWRQLLREQGHDVRELAAAGLATDAANPLTGKP